jgi:hypothetical protein
MNKCTESTLWDVKETDMPGKEGVHQKQKKTRLARWGGAISAGFESQA